MPIIIKIYDQEIDLSQLNPNEIKKYRDLVDNLIIIKKRKLAVNINWDIFLKEISHLSSKEFDDNYIL